MKLHPFFKSKEFKRLFKNFSNFSFFQITNAIIPFLALPYIVRIIGVEKFGILSFALAVNYYLQLIVQYGFDISGIQKIAANINNLKKISEIFSATLIVKLVILVFSFALLIIVIFLLHLSLQVRLVYIFTFFLIPATILQSVWFFSGVEEMKYMNYTNLISRLLYLAGIFFFIKLKSDFYFVPLINSFSISIGGVFAFYIILKKFRIVFFYPGFRILKLYLKENWSVFVSNIGLNLYRNSNVFILGMVASAEVVGFYAASEKIVKMMQTIFIPITNVFYPFFSRHKEKNIKKSLRMFKLIILLVGVASLIITLIIIFYSNTIINFFYGRAFNKSILLLQISAIVISAGIMNNMLGFIFMLNFSLERELKRNTILTGALNFVLCFILSYYYKEVGASITFTFSELFLMLSLGYNIYIKKDIWMYK